ncbi:MAG: FAD-dependent oxidoreductase [Clostridia bacterium]|nr:FAD-dependent oxidoreductase [Clostridia bacterium]
MDIKVSVSEKIYDVIVAGGGPSGCAAAVAAARNGASVLLIEASYCLGGMGTIGMVPSFAPFTDKEKVISKSIAEEIVVKYKKLMGIADEDWDWLPISFELLKSVYDEIVTESGVKVLFGSTVCAVNTENKKIKSVIASAKGGLTEYRAKMFVDCTGDADIAALCGVPFECGDNNGNIQASSLCFIISGVDMSECDWWDVHSGPKSIWEKMGDNPKYPLIDKNHFVIAKIDENTLGVNAGHLLVENATDKEEISEKMILGRKVAAQYLEAAKEYLPDVFKNAFIVSTAPNLGIRESRRIIGKYVLSIDDYIARRNFDDEIARNCYWIDCHRSKDDSENSAQSKTVPQLHYDAGESHGIPWRCLISEKMENLVVAGRTISADRAVMAAARVMPVCMTTGEAAGIGAAIAAMEDISIHSLKASKIRKILKLNGAYIKDCGEL